MTTLLLVHGMWSTAQCWAPFAGALRERGYDVVTPTLRHHDMDPGSTPDPALGKTSLLDYIADLEAEIAKLKEPPVVIGHSMGGFLAQALAARGLARAAIFLCPAPPAGWPAIVELLMPTVARSLLTSLLTKALSGRAYRLTLRQATYSCLNLLPRAEQRREYEKWVYESGHVLFELGLWFFDSRRASRVKASDVACPTLTVAASHDRITPALVVRRIAARYARRGGAFREYPEHAHWIIGEAGWEKVAADCADWIAKVVGPPKKKPAKAAAKKPAKRAPAKTKAKSK